MNKYYFLKLIFVFFIFSFSSCSHEILSGALQTTPVKVDAKLNDWEIPLRFFDNGTKINYSITNDLQNLYICMRITDAQIQTKIIHAGMEVWIDTTGKKKKNIGISFPISTGEKIKYGDRATSNTTGLESADKRDRAKMQATFLSSNKDMQLKGFQPPLNGFMHLNNDSGVNVSMNWDSTNTLIYEAKIAFKTFYKEKLTSADSAKFLGIGIVLNGMQVITPTTRGSAGQGMNPAGGMTGVGGMGSNSRLGGMGSGASGGGGHGKDYNTFANPKKIWIRVGLAVK